MHLLDATKNSILSKNSRQTAGGSFFFLLDKKYIFGANL